MAGQTLSQHLGRPITAGHIVALRADGRHWRSKKVASTTMRQIKALTEGTGNTIQAETYEPHGYSDGASVFCRVGGWDGLTHRAHRANNWTGGVKRDAKGVPSANGTYWGGDAWTITYVSATKFILNGSTWKASVGDPDSVFYHGVCWTGTLTEARAAVQAAFDFVTGYGGVVEAGPGFYAFLAGGTCTLPQNTVFKMAGEAVSHIFIGDYFNAQAVSSFAENTAHYGITYWGNRAFQRSAAHVLRYGGEDPELPIRDVTIGPLTIRDSAGYAINVGKKAPKERLVIDRLKVVACNNDGLDIKNGSNLNRHNKLLNSSCTSPGLGDKGSNRAQPRALASSPIATTSGSTSVVVTLPFRPAYNQVINLSGLSTVNGVNPNGSWRVRVKSGFTATIDMGQAASGAGSGGGAGGSVVSHAKLIGKPGFDLRGPGWTVVAPQVNGELDGCTGFRFRGGTNAQSNGIGAHRSTLIGPVVKDETTYQESYAKLLAVAADEVSISGFSLEGIGGLAGDSQGLQVIGSVNGGSFMGGIVRGVKYGGRIMGDNLRVEYQAIDCGYSLYSDGDVAGQEGAIAVDGFTTTEGSSVVRVVTALAHGLSSGQSVTVTDMAPFNGIDMNDVAFSGGSMVVVDSTTLDIDTGILATDFGSGGGADAEFFAAPVTRSTTNNTYLVRSKGALIKGFEITTRNIGAKIVNSSSSGDAAVITDNGTATEFSGNSGDLYNVDRVLNLPTSGSVSIVAADSGKTLILPANAASQVTLNLPNASALPAGFFLNVLCNNSVGVKFQMASGNTLQDGASASSNGGTYASSTNSAACCIRRRSQTGFSTASKIGTWTLA